MSNFRGSCHCRRRFYLYSSLLVRGLAHLEFPDATLEYILVCDEHLVILLPVYAQRLYVSVGIADPGSLDLKHVSVREIQFEIWKIRRSENVLVGTRTYRIESHCRKNVPCRHLSAVVVSAEAAYVVAVHPVHDLTKPSLSLPWL